MYTCSTERMRRLVCAFVVRKFSKQVFSCRGPTFIAIRTLSQPRLNKTCLRDFRPGSTQTGLYSHRRWLQALHFGFRKKMDCNIYVTKTKTLISCAETAQLIWAFVFAYAKSTYSYDTAYLFIDVQVQTAYDIRTILSHSFRKLEAQKVVTAKTDEKGIIAFSVGHGIRIL